MRVLVTFGPTYESLDQVRRLTNFSTGRLGSELVDYLAGQGNEVIALRGYYAVHPPPQHAAVLHGFTTTDHLLGCLREYAKANIDAVFHAAAVSDFKFGKIYERLADGALHPLKAGKVSTRSGTLLAELVPTAKIIAQLRSLFPEGTLCGWKYEVDGDRESVLAAARRQIQDNKTNFCIANGPAYGPGFGVVSNDGKLEHCADAEGLFSKLQCAIEER